MFLLRLQVCEALTVPFVFQEEYLSLVARLIIHFRDIRECWTTKPQLLITAAHLLNLRSWCQNLQPQVLVSEPPTLHMCQCRKQQV